jgi:hypothetical protein
MSIYNGKQVNITTYRKDWSAQTGVVQFPPTATGYNGTVVHAQYSPAFSSEGESSDETWSFLIQDPNGVVEIVHVIDGDVIQAVS